MIKRELYMNRIRPFIGGELIKVMTGIRRSILLFFPAELSVLHMQPDIGGLGHLGIVGRVWN